MAMYEGPYHHHLMTAHESTYSKYSPLKWREDMPSYQGRLLQSTVNLQEERIGFFIRKLQTHWLTPSSHTSLHLWVSPPPAHMLNTSIHHKLVVSHFYRFPMNGVMTEQVGLQMLINTCVCDSKDWIVCIIPKSVQGNIHTWNKIQ